MKRLLALLLAVVMAAALFAGCNPSSGGPEKEPEEKIEPTEDGGVTYAKADYYPIVATPITLSCAMTDNGTVGDYLKRSLWAEMAEKTGVSIDLRLLTTGGESIRLMFASRSYPDISFRLDSVATLSLVTESALMGDIVELSDEFLTSYAPNVSGLFEEMPYLRRMGLLSDGKLYGLPQVDMDETAIDLRDCWFINADWLDELGMAVPETMDDFTNYLRAVKKAAGTGSIPQNVAPLYFRHFANLGGWFSFCDSFGVYNGLNTEIVVGGTTVKHNAFNEDLKRPIKYLSMLFTEGLISEAGLGADYATYYAAIDGTKTATTPFYLGSFFAFADSHEFMISIPNLKVDDKTPAYARQTGIDSRYLANSFIIYKNNKYPVASMRYADYFYSTEGALRARYGEEGGYYKKSDDGTYAFTGVTLSALDDSQRGFENYGPNIISPELAKQLAVADVNTPHTRHWAFYNYYQKQLPTDMELFPLTALSYLPQSDIDEINRINTTVTAYIKNTTLKWIKGTNDVDAEWDAFQQKLDDLGLDTKVQLYQKALDIYNSK